MALDAKLDNKMASLVSMLNRTSDWAAVPEVVMLTFIEAVDLLREQSKALKDLYAEFSELKEETPGSMLAHKRAQTMALPSPKAHATSSEGDGGGGSEGILDKLSQLQHQHHNRHRRTRSRMDIVQTPPQGGAESSPERSPSPTRGAKKSLRFADDDADATPSAAGGDVGAGGHPPPEKQHHREDSSDSVVRTREGDEAGAGDLERQDSFDSVIKHDDTESLGPGAGAEESQPAPKDAGEGQSAAKDAGQGQSAAEDAGDPDTSAAPVSPKKKKKKKGVTFAAEEDLHVYSINLEDFDYASALKKLTADDPDAVPIAPAAAPAGADEGAEASGAASAATPKKKRQKKATRELVFVFENDDGTVSYGDTEGNDRGEAPAGSTGVDVETAAVAAAGAHQGGGAASSAGAGAAGPPGPDGGGGDAPSSLLKKKEGKKKSVQFSENDDVQVIFDHATRTAPHRKSKSEGAAVSRGRAPSGAAAAAAPAQPAMNADDALYNYKSYWKTRHLASQDLSGVVDQINAEDGTGGASPTPPITPPATLSAGRTPPELPQAEGVPGRKGGGGGGRTAAGEEEEEEDDDGKKGKGHKGGGGGGQQKVKRRLLRVFMRRRKPKDEDKEGAGAEEPDDDGPDAAEDGDDEGEMSPDLAMLIDALAGT